MNSGLAQWYGTVVDWYYQNVRTVIKVSLQQYPPRTIRMGLASFCVRDLNTTNDQLISLRCIGK